MPTYTLNELLEKMEPQARRDKALIGRCVDGLGLYTAQLAADNKNDPKIEKMKALAERILGYWGLEDAAGTEPSRSFLDTFYERVYDASTGGAVTSDVYQAAHNVIFGLYRYGEDMVVSQGKDAMSEILDMCDLMEDVAEKWDYESSIVADLNDHLKFEVWEMLNKIPLPGQAITDMKNKSYIIKQAILFDNDRGFALAHSPTAPSNYVTWQFTNDNGRHDYYWGKYMSSKERALINYINRVEDYVESYKVTEKPIPTAAAELASVVLPELSPSHIPVEVMSKSQPLVTVTFSEHERLRDIKEMPLYLANTVFFNADEQQQGDYIRLGKGFPTEFRIDFIMNGKPESYTGTYDIGSGDQTLTEHILDHAEYYREDEDHQRLLADKGEGVQTAENARFDFIIHELVPFFEKHCELSKLEADALSEAMGIHDKTAGGQPSEADAPRVTYLDSLVGYAWKCRKILNAAGLENLPELPAPFTEAVKSTPDRDAGEKPSVMDRIKAAQNAPKQPREPKPERGNKKQEPEL